MVACRRQGSTYHRLVLGMSVCDILSSLAWFMTTWPIPRETEGVFWALGSVRTCEAQGFFTQFSIATVMYNASLAIYFYFVVVRDWKEAEFSLLEPLFHLNAIGCGLATSTASLRMGLLNQVGWDCWISASPLGCKESWTTSGKTTCTRGDNGSIYQWVFYYAPLWTTITIVTALMIHLCCRVWRQEVIMKRYDFTSGLSQSSTTGAGFELTKRAAAQGVYYVGAFYCAWFFPTVYQIDIVAFGRVHPALMLLTSFFVPIQGFLNLIVYTRQHFVRLRNTERGPALRIWFLSLAIQLGLAEEQAVSTATTTHIE